MEQKKKKLSMATAAGIGMLGVASCIFPIGMLAAPGLFGYVLLSGGASAFVVTSAVAGCGSLLLAYGGAGLQSIYPLLLLLSCAAVLRGGMKRKAAYFDIALWLAAVIAMAAYMQLNMADMLAGRPAFSSMQAVAQEIVEEFGAMTATVATDELMQQYMQEMMQYARQAVYILPTYMPATICAVGAIGGFTNLLFCTHACRRAYVAMKPMRQFSLWQLPKSFGLGILMMAGAALALFFMQFSAYEAVYAAVAVVAIVPFAIQGASFTWFVLKLRRRHMMTAFFIIMIVLTFPASLFSLAVVGGMEQVFQIRRRYLQRDQNR